KLGPSRGSPRPEDVPLRVSVEHEDAAQRCRYFRGHSDTHPIRLRDGPLEPQVVRESSHPRITPSSPLSPLSPLSSLSSQCHWIAGPVYGCRAVRWSRSSTGPEVARPCWRGGGPTGPSTD